LSPEASFELAEHATDDALTPAEIDVLRLVAAGKLGGLFKETATFASHVRAFSHLVQSTFI